MNLYYNEKEESFMKVFISWSGEQSKKIALIFRDWLPTVIQSLDPFVSSEDIEKGARWNTDIAQELKESSFGLICVTKDNLSSPWLNFEAGALSKTIENTFVAPFLFDVKPSDLTGLPISQFQSTNFSKTDMKRLIETLNSASQTSLDPQRLDKAFELCYPDLENSINEVKKSKHKDNDDEVKTLDNKANNIILEEILETARNTQRLLGNTDAKLYENIEQVQKNTDTIINRMENKADLDAKCVHSKISPWYFNELLLYSSDDSYKIFPYNILMILSLYKDSFPWLYDAGYELVKTINSSKNKIEVIAELNKFSNLLSYTFSNPIFKDLYSSKKDSFIILRELPLFIRNFIDQQNKHK